MYLYLYVLYVYKIHTPAAAAAAENNGIVGAFETRGSPRNAIFIFSSRRFV